MKAVKIAIDCVMAIALCFLLNLLNTGLLWHEIIGLVLLGVVGVHLLLNRKQTKALAQSFSRKNAKAKILFIFDIILTICFILTIVSGILISEAVFPNLGISTPELVTFHTSIPYVTLIIAGIHLGLHLPMIFAAFRKMFRMKRESLLRKRVISVIGLAVFLLGFKATLDSNLVAKLGWENAGNAMPDYQGQPSFAAATSTKSIDETKNTVITVADEAVPTLEEFLGSMHCTACHKNCSLLSPQCSKGMRQAQQAEATYESRYGAESDSAQQEDNGSSQQEEDSSNDLFGNNSDDNGNSGNSGSIDDGQSDENSSGSDASENKPQLPQENQNQNGGALQFNDTETKGESAGDVAQNVLQGAGIMIFFAGGSYYVSKIFSKPKKQTHSS
ncbi:MAG: DUF4405 domain-containing protein [Christensenella sp.]|nr:DUF4405 domain-containing protein [Christensenella sp.]